eukprot:gene1335-4159_t
MAKGKGTKAKRSGGKASKAGAISKGGIRRLARRAGVKRIRGWLPLLMERTHTAFPSASVYDEVRTVLKGFVKSVMVDTVAIMELTKKKTVAAGDVLYALKKAGKTLYAVLPNGDAWGSVDCQQAGKKLVIEASNAKSSTPAKMAKKPIQKKSKKAAKKAGGRRKKGKRTYRPYIARLLKGLKGNFKISRAMAIVNSFATDLFDRIASEAGRLAKHTGKKTISSKGVQAACRMQLPGELGKHAMGEGAKASGKKKGKSGGTSTKKAGLKFSAGRACEPLSAIGGQLRRGRFAKRVSKQAAVYLAGAIEYCTNELLELSTKVAGKAKKQTLRSWVQIHAGAAFAMSLQGRHALPLLHLNPSPKPRHVALAVRNDDELNKLLATVTIAAGGVVPNVHPAIAAK